MTPQDRRARLQALRALDDTLAQAVEAASATLNAAEVPLQRAQDTADAARKALHLAMTARLENMVAANTLATLVQDTDE